MQEPIYISIENLEKNTGQIVEHDLQHYLIKNKIRHEIPPGIYYKIHNIIIKNSFCDIEYIKENKLWYIKMGHSILWSSFPITLSQFNRYTALTEE